MVNLEIFPQTEKLIEYDNSLLDYIYEDGSNPVMISTILFYLVAQNECRKLFTKYFRPSDIDLVNNSQETIAHVK